MKLYYTPLAGYVHRVEIVAREAGLWDQLTLVPTNPFDSPDDLVAANPLSKVPTLVRDDGVPMFGGPVIYEYLDSLHSGPKMYPQNAADRWEALRLFGLAEGMFDAADLRVVELRRPKGEKSAFWIDRYQHAVDRCLDRLESEAQSFTGFHIGHISIAGALLWFDWQRHNRGNHADWRPGRKMLDSWLGALVERPSYQAAAKAA
ncbi:MAG: glutathione S-transferase family protein [Proteobacteria bacterium]|nr:glutathione S-transferase family protein [Pseudomonadota bacterium]MDA1059421.1 glutathione S-transferase family protein [Pseudomonadota bacterium]